MRTTLQPLTIPTLTTILVLPTVDFVTATAAVRPESMQQTTAVIQRMRTREVRRRPPTAREVTMRRQGATVFPLVGVERDVSVRVVERRGVLLPVRGVAGAQQRFLLRRVLAMVA